MKQPSDGRTVILVRTSLLFAVAIALSFAESLLPPLPLPSVKFGLSNIPVMYALLCVGPGAALSIAVLKAGLALLTRGGAAGLLSVCGGVLSVTVMWLVRKCVRHKTYTLLSLCGAVCHNLGQWIAVSLLYAGMSLLYYLPILVISGVAAGLVTAVLLRTAAHFLRW